MAQKKAVRSLASRSRPKPRMTAKQKQRKRKLMRGYLGLFLLVLSVACVLYLLNLSQFRIGSVSVQSGPLIDSEAVEQQVGDDIYGSALKVFPKDSIFWYDKELIANKLHALYPEIESLEINLKKFDVLHIDITERVVQYQINIDGALFDLDAQSVVFQESTATNTQRVFYPSTATSTTVLGQTLMVPEDYMKMNNFLDSLQQKGIVVSQIYLQNKIQTILQLENGTRVVIHPSDNTDAVIATLNDTLTYKEFGFDRLSGEFSQPVEYINLRHGNKLFYCYTNDSCQNNYLIP